MWRRLKLPGGQTPCTVTFLASWKTILKSPLPLYPCMQVRESILTSLLLVCGVLQVLNMTLFFMEAAVYRYFCNSLWFQLTIKSYQPDRDSVLNWFKKTYLLIRALMVCFSFFPPSYERDIVKNLESRKTPQIVLYWRDLQQTFTGLPATHHTQRRHYLSATRCHFRLWLVLIIFHIVFYFNNPLSSGSCDCTIAEFIQSFFFFQHRTGIFLSYCTMLKRAEQMDLISITLICLHSEETEVAINLHMFEFLFSPFFLLFGNPNYLCKEFPGRGKGKAASGLQLTVRHNIFSKG